MKENKKKKKNLLNYIFGGQYLNSEFFDRNIWLFAMIAVYTFIYVSNRYAYQKELNEIEQLRKTRQDVKYDLLTIQSEFAEKSRQSHIEKYVNENNSKLKTATHPPILIE